MPSSSFPYTLDFRGHHGKRVFANPTELWTWVASEWASYQDFVTVRTNSKNEPYRNFREGVRHLDGATHSAAHLASLEFEDSPVFLQSLNALTQQLQMVYHNKGIPPSASYEVQALLPIVTDEPEAALAALFAVSRPTDGSVIANLDLGCCRFR